MSLAAILVGCVTGFVAAFFGIGGSSIDTPVIRLFLGLPPLQALGTPLPLTMVTATIAFFAYRRHHLVNGRIALLSLAGAVPAMVLGSFLTAFLSGKFLMLLTAVVLFFIGVDFIVKDLTERTFAVPEKPSRPPAWMVLAVAGAIGLLSGVLANGGGIFFVPAFVIFFHMRIKEAIATTLVTVAFVALPGSIIHFALGHVDLATTAAIAVGVIPMAYLGARLDIRTRSKTLMLLYGLVMAAFAVYFFINQAATP